MKPTSDTDHSSVGCPFWAFLVIGFLLCLKTFSDGKMPEPVTNRKKALVAELVAQHRHSELLMGWSKQPEGVNDKGVDGRTALQIAAADGCGTCIEELLHAGARVDEPMTDGDGLRPIHLAAAYGSLVAIQLLASAGASIDAEDANGCTPLFHAIRGNHEGVVGQLLAMGADPNHRCRYGWKPLHWAALRGLNDAVPMLVKAGASLNDEVLATVVMEQSPAPCGEHIGTLTVRCFPDCDPSKTPDTISFGLFNWTGAPRKPLPAETAELDLKPRLLNPVRLSRLLGKETVTAYLKANGGEE